MRISLTLFGYNLSALHLTKNKLRLSIFLIKNEPTGDSPCRFVSFHLCTHCSYLIFIQLTEKLLDYIRAFFGSLVKYKVVSSQKHNFTVAHFFRIRLDSRLPHIFRLLNCLRYTGLPDIYTWRE